MIATRKTGGEFSSSHFRSDFGIARVKLNYHNFRLTELTIHLQVIFKKAYLWLSAFADVPCQTDQNAVERCEQRR